MTLKAECTDMFKTAVAILAFLLAVETKTDGLAVRGPIGALRRVALASTVLATRVLAHVVLTSTFAITFPFVGGRGRLSGVCLPG